MSGLSSGRDAGRNGGLSPEEMARFFGTPGGKADKHGVLIDEKEYSQPARERDKQPEKFQPSDAQLAAEDKRSGEFRESNDLKVLGMNLDAIMDKVHSMQISKIGGQKNNGMDLIIRSMVRDFVSDIKIAQGKGQDTEGILGRIGVLGEELNRLAPDMKSYLDNQISMNRLNLPN